MQLRAISACTLELQKKKKKKNSLTFRPKLAHFSHFSLLNPNQLKMIFGQNWAKYQGYSLTFWPKLAHFSHFSLLNQNL